MWLFSRTVTEKVERTTKVTDQRKLLIIIWALCGVGKEAWGQGARHINSIDTARHRRRVIE